MLQMLLELGGGTGCCLCNYRVIVHSNSNIIVLINYLINMEDNTAEQHIKTQEVS